MEKKKKTNKKKLTLRLVTLCVNSIYKATHEMKITLILQMKTDIQSDWAICLRSFWIWAHVNVTLKLNSFHYALLSQKILIQYPQREKGEKGERSRNQDWLGLW